MSGLAIGEMDRRLELQQPDTTSASGYTAVDTVWGSKRAQLGGAEGLQQGGPQSLVTYRVGIWFRSDVRATWRLVDAAPAQVLEVNQVVDLDGSQAALLLLCTEVQ